MKAPTSRESLAQLVAQQGTMVELLRALLERPAGQVTHPNMSPVEMRDAVDPDGAEERRKNRERVKKCRAKKKLGAVTQAIRGNALKSSDRRSLRGETGSAEARYSHRYRNASPPQTPSEKQQQKSKRPSAAKGKGPPAALGRVWGQECKNAGVRSVIEDWADLKKLLFAQCGGDFDRAAGIVRTYIHACARTGRTPSTREVLTFTQRQEITSNSREASQRYLEKEAQHAARVKEQRKQQPVRELLNGLPAHGRNGERRAE